MDSVQHIELVGRQLVVPKQCEMWYKISHSYLSIVMCTGFSELIAQEKARQAIAGNFLEPILRRQLATAIRKALDQT